MIVYRQVDGFAQDLRYEKESYVLVPELNEIRYAFGFGKLPDLESLHDPAAVAAKEQEDKTERKRKEDIRNDTLSEDLLARLRVATPLQISNYIDNNVTDLTSAKRVLKQILLVLALIANGSA